MGEEVLIAYDESPEKQRVGRKRERMGEDNAEPTRKDKGRIRE